MQAVSSEPDLYQAWLALGDAHAAGGATHQAVIAWNRAASLCRTAEVLQRLGRAAIAAGRHQDARRLFTQALESPGGESLVAEVSRLMPEVVDVGAVWHNGRPAPRWHPGEVLRYAVRLLGVPLGRVELTTTFREGPDGHPAYALGMTAETHPGYFFFRVRNRYESLVSEDGVFLHHSSHENDSRAKPSMAAYDVDRLRRVCTWRYVEDGLVGIERLPLLPLGQDGLSILALAREAARTGRSCSAPTIASGSWKGTDIEVRGTEQLRWAGRDVSVVRVDVVAHFRGAAGLSGASTTWYTKDDRTLPLKSSVKLPVGSITLELLDR
jgi:hypothetical protein